MCRRRSHAAGGSHFRRYASSQRSSEHYGAEVFHGPALQARHLYLRYRENPRAVALGQAMEKPKIDYLLLLFRQTLNSGAKRDALQHAILLPIVAEDMFKRKAFVSALAL